MYRSAIVSDPAELRALAHQVLGCRNAEDRYDITQDLRWLLIEAETSSASLGLIAVVLYCEQEIVAFAPIELEKSGLDCKFGYRSLAKFPMRVATITGRCLMAKAGTEAALLAAVEAACAEYAVIRVPSLPVASSLFQWLCTEQFGTNRWHYQMGERAEHFLIQIPNTHAEYMAKFKSKTRNTIKRKIKKFQKQWDGEMRLERVTSLPDVDRFVAQVTAISSESWQGQALGNAIDKDSAARIFRCAQEGWLRGYVLYAGDNPVAFVVGRQGGGVFYYDTVGFDGKYRNSNPGEVLLSLVIEDLCGDESIESFDFRHGAAEYKRMFSTESYVEVEMLWIRKGLYNGVALAAHWGLSAGTVRSKELLARTNMLERVRSTRRRLRTVFLRG